jgi:predicted Fe-S protein YdhL (DUF1289 family)
MKHRMLTICLVALATAVSGYAALGESMRRTLTPEEHLMYVQEQRGLHWRTLSPQQRCERQLQMHQVWASMSPADLQNLRQQLDARWNALPDSQKQHLEQRIQQRFANRSARRMGGSGRAGQRRCAGTANAPL